jgi:predicted DNA-binding ribbon-helix-helix protein
MGRNVQKRNRHLVTVEAPLAHWDALRAIAERDDLSISQLVRRGIRRVLAEEEEAAPTVMKDGLEDTRASAIREPG